MVFSSVTFLCLFFPVVFILHTLVKNTKFRNIILIIASVLFYAYGEPVYVILLFVSVLINYLFGLLVGTKKSKAALAFAVVINLSFLVVFKYAGFLAESVNLLLPQGFKLPVPALSLPIGISFYTFQALSYVIDVYRSDVKSQRSFFKLLLYISFFPQLIAGPIVKYHDIDRELSERKVTVEGIKYGLFRFSAGLGKKVLIANTMAYMADSIFKMPNAEIGLTAAWIGAFTYLMQIYFDFSGYSDMAIGLGHMFGFHFLENFNYPYIADSIQDFWRRWHISLSTWFKDYLYIPLGGNRKGKARTVLNKYIVFMATGIWHGANWTFFLWGLYHGTLQMLEQHNIIPVKKNIKVFNHIYTILAVTIGFVLFRADNLAQAATMLVAMFGFGANGGSGLVHAVALLSPYCIFISLLAIIGCTPLVKKCLLLVRNKQNGESITDIAMMLGSVVILLLTLMALASDSYNPFIYFRF